MQETKKVLFALLRSGLTEKEMTMEEKALYRAEMLPGLFSLTKKHDLAHLLAAGLDKNGLLDGEQELGKKLLQEQVMAVYRYEQLHYELGELCDTLKEAKIPFIPLKGSVLRAYYSQPWLRTSCDIDVLVREEDLGRATETLVEKLGYENKGRGPHDVSMYSLSGNHIELHYDLVEEGRASEARKILSETWEHTKVKEGSVYHHEMTDERFYFYHIAHAAKHFENGGCGIRPFIDLFILDGLEGADEEKRNAVLEKGGLLKFAQAARRLSQVWLGNAEHDEVTEQMEYYVLRGGVYGNTENRVVLQQRRKGGKFKYVWSRLFLPYNVMKFQYPVLQKHRWLTPFMQVRRWFKIIFRGRVKRAMGELKYNSNVSEEESAKAQAFLNDVGL